LGLGGGLGEKGGKKPSKAEREKAAKEAAEEREKQRAAAVEKAREAQYARARAQQQAWGPPVTVKALRGEADLRAFIVPSMISHKDLMTCLKNKFPGESFVVSYADETGAKKPLNATSDVKAAMLAAMKTANDPANKDAPKGLHGLPSAKLYLEDEASAAEAAPAPAEGAAEGAAPPTQVVEIDEWILDFAALFREHLGVDAEAHLDLHAEVRDAKNRPDEDSAFGFFWLLAFGISAPPVAGDARSLAVFIAREAMTTNHTTLPIIRDERVA
jgi:hypothetical protein